MSATTVLVRDSESADTANGGNRGRHASSPSLLVFFKAWLQLLVGCSATAVVSLLSGLLMAALLPVVVGWTPSVVATGSMAPRIDPGDVVVAAPQGNVPLRAGMVLWADNPTHPDERYIHRLVQINPDGTVITKGDANRDVDSTPLQVGHIHGILRLRVPWVGLPVIEAQHHRGTARAVVLVLGAWLLLAMCIKLFRRNGTGRGDSRRGGRFGCDGSMGRGGSGGVFRPRHRRRSRTAVVTESAAARSAAGLMIIVMIVALGLVIRVPMSAAFFSRTAANGANSLNANGTFAAQYHPTIVADGPLEDYRMDDASGNNATDSSGHGTTGTYSASTGSGTYATATGATTGDGDGAATFGGATANGGSAGTGACGYLVSDAQLATTNTFTIELWFKTSATTGGMLMNSGIYKSTSGFSSTSSEIDRYLYINSSNHVEFGFGAGTNDAETSTTYNNGSWHLVDAVDNAGTNSLYIDGALKVGPLTGDTAAHNGFWRVGCDDTSALNKTPTDNGFNGSIDDVAVYPTALTGTKVTAHYAARTSATYATTIGGDSPALYWRMDDGLVTDLSGNGATAHYLNMASGGSVTLGVAGALLNAQATSKAATYSSALGMAGASQNVTASSASTTELWFKATASYAVGGTLIALANSSSGEPTISERVVWMDNAGLIHFGVYNGTDRILTSPSAYNDGNWHMVDSSIGAAGQKLYIDGVLVASNSGVTTAQADTTATWRWGYSIAVGWAPVPSSFYFNGGLDEISTFTSQLSDATVLADYNSNY